MKDNKLREFLGNEWLKVMDDIGENINCYEATIKHLEHYEKRISAFKKLLTITEDWNYEDKFIPDFSNLNQIKCAPTFCCINGHLHFLMARTFVQDIRYGPICFKTLKRAEDFGKKFIDLWSDFLL